MSVEQLEKKGVFYDIISSVSLLMEGTKGRSLYKDEEIFEYILQAIRDMGVVIGNRKYNELIIKPTPRDFSDDTLINEALYENHDNIKVKQHIEIADATSPPASGHIETVSIKLIDQLACFILQPVETDTLAGHRAIAYDISLDKPITIGDTDKYGTWLSADLSVPIETNKIIDITRYHSPLFSVKATLTTDDSTSPKLHDLRIIQFFFDVNSIINYCTQIVDATCSYIYEARASQAIAKQTPTNTIDYLAHQAVYYREKAGLMPKRETVRRDKVSISGDNSHNPWADSFFGVGGEDIPFDEASNRGIRKDGKVILGYW